MLTHSSFSFYSDSLFCGQKLFNSHPLKIYTTRGRSKSQVISRKRSIRSTFQPQLTTQNFIFSIFSSQSSTMFIAVQNKNARSEQKEFSATAASVSNRNHFWRAWYEQRSLMLRERKRKIWEKSPPVELTNFSTDGCQQSFRGISQSPGAFKATFEL